MYIEFNFNIFSKIFDVFICVLNLVKSYVGGNRTGCQTTSVHRRAETKQLYPISRRKYVFLSLFLSWMYFFPIGICFIVYMSIVQALLLVDPEYELINRASPSEQWMLFDCYS